MASVLLESPLSLVAWGGVGSASPCSRHARRCVEPSSGCGHPPPRLPSLGDHLLLWHCGASFSFACDADQVLAVALEEFHALASLQLQLRPRAAVEGSASRAALRPTEPAPAGSPGGRPQLWALGAGVLQPEELREVARRCIFLRAAYRPVACGASAVDCAQAAEAAVRSWSEEKRARAWALSHVRGVHHGARMGTTAAIEGFTAALELLGPVRLDAPETPLAVLEEYASEAKEHMTWEEAVLRRVWFLEVLGEKSHHWMKPYMLENRQYLSQTTTRPEVAMLLANLAQVRQGDRVLDPCCGSGGLLLAAAAVGATELWGIDANPDAIEARRPARPRRGRGGSPAKEGLAGNFADLGLPEPEFECGDALDPGLRAYKQQYDALLADLPYGWREFAEHHSLRDLAVGVLKVAARVLRPGRRAVVTWPEQEAAGAVAEATAVGLRVVASLGFDIHKKLRRRIFVLEQP